MAVVICKEYLLLLFLSASLLRCSFAQTTCAVGLKNTVVLDGSSFTFPRVTNGEPVEWQVASSSDSFNSIISITNYDDVVASPFTTAIYTVGASGLTIVDSTMAPQGADQYATAGLYILNYNTPDSNPDCSTGAGLVVIESLPVCSVDLSDPNNPILNCSIGFADYIQQQIIPIMTWTNGAGTVVKMETPIPNSLDLNNNGLQRSDSLLPVASNDASAYSCSVTFSAPSSAQPPFVDPNPPTFTSTCVAQNTALTTAVVPATTTNIAATTAQPPVTTTASLTTTTVPATTTTTTVPSTSTTPSSTTSSPPSTSSSTPASTTSSQPSTSSSTPASTTSSPPSTSSSTPAATTTPSVLSLPASTISTSPSNGLVTPSAGPSSLGPSPASLASSGPAQSTLAPTSVNGAVSPALAIVLSLVFGCLIISAAICCCWGFCCFYPVAATDEKRRRKRRVSGGTTIIHRIFYYWSGYPTVNRPYDLTAI